MIALKHPINRLSNSKEGSFAIPFVLLIFIALMVVTGFTDLIQKRYVMEEAQSVMDMAGTSALQAGVDEVELKHGNFVIHEDVVREKFVNLVSNTLDNFNNVNYINFRQIDVWTEYSTYGLGESSEPRNQAFIDAVMVMEVNGSPYFNIDQHASKVYYDARRNENFTVSYLGESPEGKQQLMVRSVSRIVLR